MHRAAHLGGDRPPLWCDGGLSPGVVAHDHCLPQVDRARALRWRTLIRCGRLWSVRCPRRWSQHQLQQRGLTCAPAAVEVDDRATGDVGGIPSRGTPRRGEPAQLLTDVRREAQTAQPVFCAGVLGRERVVEPGGACGQELVQGPGLELAVLSCRQHRPCAVG